MKKIMKKNQVIITSLAILIAVAGYLNFADVDLGFKDKETSTDSSSILEEVDYDLTDETALLDENGADGAGEEETDETGTPGEAVLTGASDFAAQAKISREQVRSQNKADLQEIINNTDIGDDQKQEAVNTMVAMTETSEKESAAEMLLEAKGFENVVVNLTGETADIVVPDSELDDARRAQIEDIVKRKTGIAAEDAPLVRDVANAPVRPMLDSGQTHAQQDKKQPSHPYTQDEAGYAQPGGTTYQMRQDTGQPVVDAVQNEARLSPEPPGDDFGRSTHEILGRDDQPTSVNHARAQLYREGTANAAVETAGRKQNAPILQKGILLHSELMQVNRIQRLMAA